MAVKKFFLIFAFLSISAASFSEMSTFGSSLSLEGEKTQRPKSRAHLPACCEVAGLERVAMNPRTTARESSLSVLATVVLFTGCGL
jgi:hypothetical protein